MKVPSQSIKCFIIYAIGRSGARLHGLNSIYLRIFINGPGVLLNYLGFKNNREALLNNP